MDTLRQYYGDGMGDDYSDVNILRREAMRFEPRILEILKKIWNIADHDSSRSVTQEEYHIMFRRLARVLVHEEVDPEELYDMAQEEFEQDVSCRLASSRISCTEGLNPRTFLQRTFRRMAKTILITTLSYSPGSSSRISGRIRSTWTSTLRFWRMCSSV